jgi:3-hydroxyacyl-CoA dehydrogenase
MRLAEIVAHAHTSPAVVSAVCALARRCGKNPVVIQDSPTRWGFVGSRLFMALHREAQAIVAEGVASPDAVDAIVRDTFRWPAGPFETVKHAATGWDPDVNPSRGHPGTSISRNAQLMGLDTTRGQD